uniref:Putative cyclin-D4-1-like isoform X1 n=1 Tax=Davidia involucrata TaxID=16924 RepID=A0A5B6ZID3_DAVIN
MFHSADNSATSLYCDEDAGDVFSSDADTWISDPPASSSSSSVFFPPSDETTISGLIDKEPHHMPRPDYLRRCRDRSIDPTARQDSITWILKVNAHCQFRPVTAFLSVNYFDRFLSSHSLPQANGWPFQLLSVACLSLAAKMEEPYVPLLLDLQVFEPSFVFEPGTILRMEVLVMAILDWRLRSVTPFDYLDYFISKLACSGSKPDLFGRVLYTSSDLILSTTRVIDFLDFPPSIIAAAAVLSAAGESVDFLECADWLPESIYERVNKEMVRSCHQLMEEYLIDTCPSAEMKDRRVPPLPPPSPIGVLDAAACGSCDTRSESRTAVSGSGTSEAEPPNKRLRSSASDVQQDQP